MVTRLWVFRPSRSINQIMSCSGLFDAIDRVFWAPILLCACLVNEVVYGQVQAVQELGGLQSHFMSTWYSSSPISVPVPPCRALALPGKPTAAATFAATMTYFHRHRHNHVSAMRPSHSGRTPSSHSAAARVVEPRLCIDTSTYIYFYISHICYISHFYIHQTRHYLLYLREVCDSKGVRIQPGLRERAAPTDRQTDSRCFVLPLLHARCRMPDTINHPCLLCATFALVLVAAQYSR
ncbi:hypothetical protein V8C42DRAFT_135056 [Trichoderma barbatum]